MTKENIKKSILVGVISGFTAAVTILFAVWIHTTATHWYRDYIERVGIESGGASHCDRSGMNELIESIDSLKQKEQE